MDDQQLQRYIEECDDRIGALEKRLRSIKVIVVVVVLLLITIAGILGNSASMFAEVAVRESRRAELREIEAREMARLAKTAQDKVQKESERLKSELEESTKAKD